MYIMGRTFQVEKINSRDTKTKLNVTWQRNRKNSRSKIAKKTVIRCEFKEFFKAMVRILPLWQAEFYYNPQDSQLLVYVSYIIPFLSGWKESVNKIYVIPIITLHYIEKVKGFFVDIIKASNS